MLVVKLVMSDIYIILYYKYDLLCSLIYLRASFKLSIKYNINLTGETHLKLVNLILQKRFYLFVE